MSFIKASLMTSCLRQCTEFETAHRYFGQNGVNETHDILQLFSCERVDVRIPCAISAITLSMRMSKDIERYFDGHRILQQDIRGEGPCQDSFPHSLNIRDVCVFFFLVSTYIEPKFVDNGFPHVELWLVIPFEDSSDFSSHGSTLKSRWEL